MALNDAVHISPALTDPTYEANNNDIQLSVVESEEVDGQNTEEQTGDIKQEENDNDNGADKAVPTETNGENKMITEQPQQQEAKEEEEEEEEEANGPPPDYHPVNDGQTANLTNSNDPQNNNDGVYMKSELTPFFINYWFIIAITLAATSVGFILYNLTDIWWIICICAGVGFIASSSYEGFRYYKIRKMKKTMNVVIDVKDEDDGRDYELEEGMAEWKEDPDEDGVYVETQFDNSYIDTIDDGKRKKMKKKKKRNTRITGSTRAYIKRGSGCLMVEKRALYTFQDYKGYEIGGGLSSLAGFSITIIVQLIKMGVEAGTDSKVDHAGNVAILLFITLALLCLGCIIEIELRKKNVLPPNKKLYLTATSIGLHEIKSIDRHSTTNYQNVSSELDEKGGSGLLMKKIAIKWFHCLLGIFKLIQWIVLAVTINTAMVMLIFVFIIFGLLYDLSINKSNSAIAPSSTLNIMIFTWIAVGIGIFGLLFLSQAIYPGNKEYYRLSLENRIQKPQQTRLWILILVATILLAIVAIMMTALDADVYTRKTEKVEVEGVDSSSRITEQIFCISVDADSSENSGNSGNFVDRNQTFPTANTGFPSPAPTDFRRRMQFDDLGLYSSEPFCVESREYTIFFALLLTLIAWWILLYAAYFWRQNDKAIFRFDLHKNKKMRRVWRRYSVINIGLKTTKKSSFFGGWNQVINIELDPEDAVKLHDYLNSVVPWFQLDHNCNTSFVYKKETS